MEGEVLKNKPLVEAILEVRWSLEQKGPDLFVDPHYRLLLARLYDRLSTEYPEPEELPIAAIPDEVTSYAVKHRFRHVANGWPLIQVGPGILTLNETSNYTWPDFRTRSIAVVGKLFEAHPKPDELRVRSLLLRYIDAVDLDYSKEDVFLFLSEKLKVSIAMPGNLFEGTGVSSLPARLALDSSFRTAKPQGMVNVRFVTGQIKGKGALIWETQVHSDDALPELPEGFDNWIDAAHGIAHDWFFKLIDGELKRRFSGE